MPDGRQLPGQGNGRAIHGFTTMEFASHALPGFSPATHGRLANTMIEYMVALKFANLVPGCQISNISIPELSRSVDNIYLAVSGLFNPMQKPSVDLVPFGATRYKFFCFRSITP